MHLHSSQLFQSPCPRGARPRSTRPHAHYTGSPPASRPGASLPEAPRLPGTLPCQLPSWASRPPLQEPVSKTQKQTQNTPKTSSPPRSRSWPPQAWPPTPRGTRGLGARSTYSRQPGRSPLGLGERERARRVTEAARHAPAARRPHARAHHSPPPWPPLRQS